LVTYLHRSLCFLINHHRLEFHLLRAHFYPYFHLENLRRTVGYICIPNHFAGNYNLKENCVHVHIITDKTCKRSVSHASHRDEQLPHTWKRFGRIGLCSGIRGSNYVQYQALTYSNINATNTMDFATV
jgi:hypothetical protein